MLAGCVLLGVQDAPEGAAVCKLSDGSWVGFYQVIPLTENELEYKIQHMDAAVELYGFCPDVIDQGPEDATVGALADVLRQSTVWYFWWD